MFGRNDIPLLSAFCPYSRRVHAHIQTSPHGCNRTHKSLCTPYSPRPSIGDVASVWFASWLHRAWPEAFLRIASAVFGCQPGEEQAAWPGDLRQSGTLLSLAQALRIGHLDVPVQQPGH